MIISLGTGALPNYYFIFPIIHDIVQVAGSLCPQLFSVVIVNDIGCFRRIMSLLLHRHHNAPQNNILSEEKDQESRDSRDNQGRKSHRLMAELL